MGCQATVYIGVIVSELLPKFSDPDGEYDTGIVLTRQNAAGQDVNLPVVFSYHDDGECNVGLEYGKTVFGVRMNSRYVPGFLDCDAPHGEGDLFSLSLEEISRHRDAVRAVLPEAELVIVHEWF